MSDRPGITSELRVAFAYEMATGSMARTSASIDAGKLMDLCDAIDAIHASLEAENEHLRDSDGWIELPKDADGEYIHIGDVMECEKLPNGNRVCGEVKAIGDGYVWLMNVQYKIHAEYLRHHATTVEDVLREMLDALGELPSNATNDAIVAEYAKRLTLAGDAE